MKNSFGKYLLLPFAGFLLLLAAAACQKVPVGYLLVNNASFSPDTLTVYHKPAETSPRANEATPWVSNRIQGVQGTLPINYRYTSVKVSAGANKDIFEKMVQEGEISVRGGLLLMTQKACKALPVGFYTISMEAYNEGHTKPLPNIFTFNVQATEEVMDMDTPTDTTDLPNNPSL